MKATIQTQLNLKTIAYAEVVGFSRGCGVLQFTIQSDEGFRRFSRYQAYSADCNFSGISSITCFRGVPVYNAPPAVHCDHE